MQKLTAEMVARGRLRDASPLRLRTSGLDAVAEAVAIVVGERPTLAGETLRRSRPSGTASGSSGSSA